MIEQINKNDKFTAINVGKFDDLMEYELVHPKLKVSLAGKVFLKEPTDATGTEISYNILPPGAALPYFHIHRQVEETYLIIKGAGLFQVDDECFPISEGSVIRVAPEGERCLTRTSQEPLIYIVIQSKAGSLEEHTTADGKRVKRIPMWEKDQI